MWVSAVWRSCPGVGGGLRVLGNRGWGRAWGREVGRAAAAGVGAAGGGEVRGS